MDIEFYKNLIEYFLHETININDNIKTHSEIISKGINDKQGIPHHIDIIHENSTLLNILTNLIEYSLNPEFKVRGEKDLRSIHGKFKKAGISLRRRLKIKNVKLNLECEELSLINLYPIIDSLPYLLLDNALKYSHKDSEIDISICDLGSYILIEINNYGPEIFEDELHRLTDRGFRGFNAVESNASGSGLGLSIANDICISHQGTLEIKLGNRTYNFNNKNYQEFKVLIHLPK